MVGKRDRTLHQTLGFLSTSHLMKQGSSWPPPDLEGGMGMRRHWFLRHFFGTFPVFIELFSGSGVARWRPCSTVSCRKLWAEFAAACSA